MAEKMPSKRLLQISTFVVLHQCQNKVSFQRKASSFVLKLLLKILKAKQRCLFIREHFLPFMICIENFYAMPEPFFEKLRLLENNRSAGFESSTDFAFSMASISYHVSD